MFNTLKSYCYLIGGSTAPEPHKLHVMCKSLVQLPLVIEGISLDLRPLILRGLYEALRVNFLPENCHFEAEKSYDTQFLLHFLVVI